MLIVIEYQVNKNYIAQVLCINKTKPQLQCNGKCHLAKELKKADQAEQKLPAPLKEKFEVLYFCEALPAISFSQNSFALPVIWQSFYQSIFYTSPPFGIFHPPRFLA